MLTWVTTNWQAIVVALLAVDAALIPIFPNAGILKTLSGYLTSAKQL